MQKRIEVGDKVKIDVTENICIIGTVLYTPSATGDAWIIQQDTQLVYVQTYLCMYKTDPA